MVTLGDRSQGSPHLALANGTTIPLNRIPLGERGYGEGWLQERIRRHPEMLPVGEIEPVFAPPVSIGVEVPAGKGSIDNLLISPQGYLTIVETKLWRNPEARRAVISQTIDYAKDVSRWSFEHLDRLVRDYHRQYGNQDRGVIETLRPRGDSHDEALLIDAISRNLKGGRLLLLVAGDGIREEAEALVDFLSHTPQLQFTLAMVELQLYELEIAGERNVVIVPRTLARTREIVRAVVRIEGDVGGRVVVESAPEVVPTSEPARFTITAEDFFDSLKQSAGTEGVVIAQRLIADVKERGLIVDWGQASFSIRPAESAGTPRKLTLLVVHNEGVAYPHWLAKQLRGMGIAEEIAYRYVERLANLFEGCSPKPNERDSLIRAITLGELDAQYNALLGLLQEAAGEIKRAADV